MLGWLESPSINGTWQNLHIHIGRSMEICKSDGKQALNFSWRFLTSALPLGTDLGGGGEVTESGKWRLKELNWPVAFAKKYGFTQGCGAGAGAGAGAAGADAFWSEPESEPEPPKRFARSRSRSRSRRNGLLGAGAGVGAVKNGRLRLRKGRKLWKNNGMLKGLTQLSFRFELR